MEPPIANSTFDFIDLSINKSIDFVVQTVKQIFGLIFCLVSMLLIGRILNSLLSKPVEEKKIEIKEDQQQSEIKEEILKNSAEVSSEVKQESPEREISGWESQPLHEPRILCHEITSSNLTAKTIKKQLKRKCMSVGPIMLSPNSQIVRTLNVEDREERYHYDILPVDTVKTVEGEVAENVSEPRSTPVIPDEIIYADSPDSSLYGSEDEEQEDVSQYRRGGYHPIHLGDVLHSRYRVVRKVGWGHFSTVWLCRDLEEEKYVALKVVKSAQHYTETAADEIRLLEVIRDADPFDHNHDRVVKLLNHFTVRGVNGVHTCLVFEALGCSLYKLIVKSNYQGLAIQQVKSIIKQVLQGLDYLHTKCHIIHTDVKPENILIVMDNAASINQQIDEAITSLKGRGYGAHWFPDSYVSTLEKRSKKSPSPLAQSETLSAINPIKDHADEDKILPTSVAIDSHSVPLANSLDLSSDDDHLEKLTGASSSTTTTSSSFLENKRLASLDDEMKPIIAPLSLIEQLKASNTSLNKLESEIDVVIGNETATRYRVEQQRKGSIPNVNTNQNKNENKTKTKPKLSKFTSKQISYSSVLQSLLNNPNVKVKIADLGNACFDHYHFTDDIQTRQYRSIEVLLGVPYTYSADIWSTACLAFELATGDYLFDPHSGENYSRDEDHLAHIIELLGGIPPNLIMRGKHGLKYFTSYGNLRHITKLKTWSLFNVLIEKYEWNLDDARSFTDFLLPMLEYNPLLRASARQCLQHSWLEDVK
ncbi:CLUMA_CG020565, isoform A [Clunio marinus]|uniref:non-specific serine/threonine protein kinase n=1 Tax=Clunio marinus TaxID=568069 RepID=A0A1J1J5C1_9DIPT|nr:CLUMA_CG020565, isoform A [Clunio marinus]